MTYKEYSESRKNLITEANTLIDEGKLDEANAKMDEVKDLDEKWDKTAETLANAKALEGEQRAYNIQNITDSAAAGAVATAGATGVVTAELRFPTGKEDTTETPLYATDVYKNAWAKTMMGKPLTAEEAEVFKNANDYTHTTGNTGVVIPKTVADGIWDMIEELYPYWNDIQKTYVKGNYTVPISDESTDAKWYEEADKVEDGKETLRELALTGCELSRSITIAWKLKEMAPEDFIPYIQRKMARKMGAGLGYGVTHGKGKPASNEHKAEPMGVVTALKKETEKPQVATYEKGKLTYKDLTNERAKVKVGANELCVYANSNTIWSELANVTDANGKPIFIPDPSVSGVFRILGMEVKQDDAMSDGEILMSSPYVGYQANVNKELTVMTEDHVKDRTTDYCGYAIVDGGVTSTKAHALLEYTATEHASETDQSKTPGEQ